MNVSSSPCALRLLVAALCTTCAWAEVPDIAPVWEWQASDAESSHFSDQRKIPVPDLVHLYDPSKPFSVEVKLKPAAEQERLAGIISDYSGSTQGGWYLSLGQEKGDLAARFVVVESEGGYRTGASKQALSPENEQTLLLIKDEQQYTLWLDGKLIAQLPSSNAIVRGPRNVPTIGERSKSFYQGDIFSVRVWDQAVPPPSPATPSSTAGADANRLWNSSFEQGDNIAEALLWHRMTGSSVTPSPGWKLVDGEAHEGRRSLKGRSGSTLTVMDEIWEDAANDRPWVFSIWMKASHEDMECELSVGAYWRLEEQQARKTVRLTTDWQRYEMVVQGIPSLSNRSSQILGPVNFRITPQGSGDVWVDALQWQPGREATAWSEAPATGKGPSLPAPEFADTTAIVRPKLSASTWTGDIPLQVFSEASGHFPVTVGIPFAQGRWNGGGHLSLKNADGQSLPVQSEVLAPAPDNQGVRMLGLHFTSPLKKGRNDFTLSIASGAENPDVAPAPFLWQVQPPGSPGGWWREILAPDGRPLVGSATLHAVGADGRVYDSTHDPETSWSLEQDGPLYRVIRISGRLMDAEGHSLLGYVARLHCWAAIPGIKMEISAINTLTEGSVAVRSISWQAEDPAQEVLIAGQKSERTTDRFASLSLYDPASNNFQTLTSTPTGVTTKDGPAVLSLERQGDGSPLILQAPESWQRNPSAIAWDRGKWAAYLWPADRTRGLLLPRGMALTREFWLRESRSGEPALWETPPVALAAPSWWTANDLVIPLGAANPAQFPLMSRLLAPEVLMERTNEATIKKEKGWGAFDYGDFHGDGGWSNLESFVDWTALLTGLQSGDPSALRMGLTSARHYRDSDMNQQTGECYIHNFNHVSGSTDTSHAWPSGVALDYLLTGSKRSKEVLLKHGESLLATDVNYIATKGLRSLGRWLANLADVYLVSADPRYPERYFQQIEACRKALEADTENPDRSIFSYIGHSQDRRLVPFHAWYGIAALQKMQDLTGDKRLAPFISGEIDATLNPELHRPDIEQLWPGLTTEEGLPLILAFHAQHRGSFFFPVMTAEEEAHPERKKLALDTLYAWALEGRGVGNIQTILNSAPLRHVPAGTGEAALIKTAADRMWKGASDHLLNGDFSLSADHWPHWRPFPTKSIGAHINWEHRRQDMVSLDADIRKIGPRSLRFNLLPKTFFSKIAVDTARVRIPAGENLLTGWLRWNEGAKPPLVSLRFSNLNGDFQTLALQTTEQGVDVESSPSWIAPKVFKLSPPDANGWRKLEVQFTAKERSIAALNITTSLQKGSRSGNLWLDSMELKPIPNR